MGHTRCQPNLHVTHKVPGKPICDTQGAGQSYVLIQVLSGYHRASGSPGYGTQPLHWQQKQNRPKRWKKVPKSAKKTCQIGLILVLLSAHIERVSVSRMRDFLSSFSYSHPLKRSYPLINRPGVAGAVLQTPSSLSKRFMVCGNIFKALSIPNRKS